MSFAGSPSGSDLSYDFLGSCGESPLTRVEPRGRWYLVWCHERCRKKENEAFHDALAKLVQEAGGIFFCIKKANSFEAWRTRMQRRAPFLLLTDCREIKPCVLAMARGEPQNRPLLIIVFAEQQKQVDRLTPWIADLPAQGIHDPVRVVRDLEELAALLPALVYHATFAANIAQIPDPRLYAVAACAPPQVLATSVGACSSYSPYYCPSVAWALPPPMPCFPYGFPGAGHVP